MTGAVLKLPGLGFDGPSRAGYPPGSRLDFPLQRLETGASFQAFVSCAPPKMGLTPCARVFEYYVVPLRGSFEKQANCTILLT